jgi:hypothetical protein
MKKTNLSHPQPYHLFIRRLSRNLLFGLITIVIALLIGMAGYHYFENMPWIDAFVNACMILSGMGPLGTLQTNSGKIFAGCYALFSGILFLVTVALVFTPVVHRMFHKFHLQEK